MDKLSNAPLPHLEVVCSTRIRVTIQIVWKIDAFQLPITGVIDTSVEKSVVSSCYGLCFYVFLHQESSGSNARPTIKFVNRTLDHYGNNNSNRNNFYTIYDPYPRYNM